MITLLIKNKNMLKKIRIRLPKLYSAIFSLSFFGTIITPGIVFADQYTQQIQNLQTQNDTTQQNVNGLQSKAQTFQNTISQLFGEISAMQTQITNTRSNIDTVRIQIIANQQKLDAQKNDLSSLLKSMYVDGHMTTLESLATSQSISDFVTKVEYQNIVQQQIQGSLKSINTVQATLTEEKTNLDKSLANFQLQNIQLAAEQQQETSLLSYNQQQQDNFNQQILVNNSKITTLEAEQAAAIAAASGTNGNSRVGGKIRYTNLTAGQWCGGGYTFCWTSYLDQYVDDPWGFHYARECVHYVLDYLQRNGYYIPVADFGRYGGNAYQWIGVTTADGAAQVVTDPQTGDVAYMAIGGLGHVAIVNYVNNDGSVNVSQFNWAPGEFSTMDLYTNSNVQFLRFHH